ncbi:MAG: MBL fold metallo-hydrolase [Candidatus Gottesmanbacteria bacterium]
MDIIHLGHSSFKIRSRQASVITDPFAPDLIGLKFPKVDADIVTISHDHQDHNQANLVGNNPIIFTGPGEYEVKGIKILGLTTFHDQSGGSERGLNTVYQFKMDNLTIVHLGDLGNKLTTEQVERLNGADIVMVPVGGIHVLDAKQAAEVIAQLDPRIVIPMHYYVDGLKFDINPVTNFLKEMGKEDCQPQPKLSITKDKLPEQLEIIVLE